MQHPTRALTAETRLGTVLSILGVALQICVLAPHSHAQWGEASEDDSPYGDKPYESSPDDDASFGDSANGDSITDADVFAHVDPDASTAAKVTVAAGVGAGIHESEQHNEWGKLVTGGTPAPTGTVSTSLIATTPSGLSYGGALSFVTTIGQRVVVAVPHSDERVQAASSNTVSSPARKQEFTVAGLLRPVLTPPGESSIGLPVWFGFNFIGFNTEQKTPVLEYTLLDLFLRPGLRIQLGAVSLELTGMLGATIAIGSAFDEARLARVGLTYAAQLDVQISISGPFIALLRSRYKQTSFKAHGSLQPFADRFMTVNLCAGLQF